MHYRSLVGITAAAFSLALSSQALAQSAPNQAPHQNAKTLHYNLEPAPLTFQLAAAAQPVPDQSRKLGLESATSAYKWPAAVAAASDTAGAALPDDALRIAPDQRTKSAAYKWEAAFLVLSAIDAAETISCLDRATCTEHNPLWGRHPSTGKIVAAKLGLGLLHLGVFKLIADRDPHTALRAAQVSTVVQGGAVLLNLHAAF